jgi:hypothetical protein
VSSETSGVVSAGVVAEDAASVDSDEDKVDSEEGVSSWAGVTVSLVAEVSAPAEGAVASASFAASLASSGSGKVSSPRSWTTLSAALR